MAHQLLPEIDRDWLIRVTDVLLIRDPADVLASYRQSRERPEPADLGVLQQSELYAHLVAVVAPPPVIDVADFVRHPTAHLEWLCHFVGVPFSDSRVQLSSGH